MKGRACIGASAAVLVVLAVLASQSPDQAPSFQEVKDHHHPSDLRLLDRSGQNLGQRRVDARVRRWAWTPLLQISPALQRAVVAVEDRRFWNHDGVDYYAIVASITEVLRGHRPRGASTITMQLARWLEPHLQRRQSERGLRFKWQQMRAAWAIERAWSKDEIFEAYLNVIAFRGEIHGINAAAGTLFAKAPHGLSDAESLVLAALLRDPTASAQHVAARARHLATRLGGAGTEVDIDSAISALQSPGRLERDDLAPHLAARLLTPAVASDVSTAIDIDLQRLATATLRRHLLALHDRHVDDGAVLIVDNTSGEVMAYVGGSGGLSQAPQVDAVRARRQAGSTLKPFLYATALERQVLTAASLLDDSPVEVAESTGVYRPENYDHRFHGMMTLRRALAGSINVPAVRTLMLLRPNTLLSKLRRLGFAQLNRPAEFYGPALALGAVDVNLWELVNAYRSLANGGAFGEMRLLKPGTGQGTGSSPMTGNVFDPAAVFIVDDILADRESRALTFGLDSPLGTTSWTAVKTGTSKDMRDNWCIGFSDRYTIGVWVGNASGAPMHDVTGVSGAALIWHDLMESMHRQHSSQAPTPPLGVVAQWSEFPDTTELARREWYLAGTEPITAVIKRSEGREHIVTPVAGAIVAIDPDIGMDRQRIPLQAQTAAADRRWVVDGIDIGSVRGDAWWTPEAGPHTLTLQDTNGRILDTVRLRVRGAWPEAARSGRRPKT